MELPLQLQFRNLDHSPAIEAAVRKHVDKLKSFNGDIISCRVAIESPHKHQYKGKLYHVVVDVRVPGKEIVVSRAPDDQRAHEDVYVAIRDAFAALRRQLEDYVQKRRGKTKRHEPPAHGRILSMEPDGDYGRIETPDNRVIYDELYREFLNIYKKNKAIFARLNRQE